MAKKILLAVLVFVNIFLLFRLIWSEHGIFTYLNMRNRAARLESQLQDMDAKGLELSKEIRRLKSDRSYQELIIRDRMNYVKENEVLYIFSGRGDEPQGAAGDEKKD